MAHIQMTTYPEDISALASKVIELGQSIQAEHASERRLSASLEQELQARGERIRTLEDHIVALGGTLSEPPKCEKLKALRAVLIQLHGTQPAMEKYLRESGWRLRHDSPLWESEFGAYPLVAAVGIQAKKDSEAFLPLAR